MIPNHIPSLPKCPIHSSVPACDRGMSFLNFDRYNTLLKSCRWISFVGEEVGVPCFSIGQMTFGENEIDSKDPPQKP